MDEYTFGEGQCAYCDQQGTVLKVIIKFYVYENIQHSYIAHESTDPICLPCLLAKMGQDSNAVKI